ncbi:hypothetical protein [Ancylobacter rudongensis]|uniref:Uncharacterized protein n=1 Tax=Ancylobacter rudongensis TaxID=177413 RepID=A0A1G4UPE7_9HYPH|nr:hypothetical protein [Ancylobacter rudongensis]SCW95523.1 hypothetical protein SAMN05660859_0047 [Ancylobacter rudongensis]
MAMHRTKTENEITKAFDTIANAITNQAREACNSQDVYGVFRLMSQRMSLEAKRRRILQDLGLA